MGTMTEVLPERKASKRSAINWVSDLQRAGCGELTIHTDRASCVYQVAPIGTPWEGKAFHFAKVTPGTDAESESYQVFCHRGRQDNLCDCREFSRFGHCKHVDAAFAIIDNGWDTLSLVNPDANVSGTERPF